MLTGLQDKILRWMAFREPRSGATARPRKGFTVFFTGLSGSGKSTIAKALSAKLMEIDGWPVTLLDGDVVRKHLSSDLGFSREDRDTNILRIGFLAAEITKHRGITICAVIAPYDAARRQVRSAIQAQGGFVLVYLSAPLELCERRDPKGLYAKARAGLIQSFTGISDPYEVPADAELVVDTSKGTPEGAVQEIVRHLSQMGLLSPASPEFRLRVDSSTFLTPRKAASTKRN